MSVFRRSTCSRSRPVAGGWRVLEGRFGRKHLDSRDSGSVCFGTAPTCAARWYSPQSAGGGLVLSPGSGRSCLMTRPRRSDVGLSSASRRGRSSVRGRLPRARNHRNRGPSLRRAMVCARPRPARLGIVRRRHSRRAQARRRLQVPGCLAPGVRVDHQARSVNGLEGTAGICLSDRTIV